MPRRSRRRRLIVAVVALLVAVGFLARRTGLGPAGTPPFDPADFRDAPVVEATEAASLVGERAVVCGTVVRATYARDTGGQPTFLNLERAYPEQPFDVVVWGRHRPRFQSPPELAYRDRRICVAGTVTTHQGTPRIEVTTPEQIRTRGST